MSPSAVLAFWAVAGVLIVVPGPDWAFAISAGARRQVVPAAGGIVLGYVAMTLVVAAGLGLLIASTPVAMSTLTVVGSLYLIWLGVRTARHPGVLGEPLGEPTSTARSTVLQGMAVSGLNPKGLLIFVALLPQFAERNAAWPLPAQLGVLGLVFTLTCGAVYLLVGASAARLLRARPAAARAVSRISGASMCILGTALIVAHLKH